MLLGPVRRSALRGARRVLPAVLVATALAGVIGPVAGSARAGDRVWGVDVASYQHPAGAGIDWTAVRSSGATFAIVKATEGSDYRNPYFSGDWAAARAAGLLRGAYSFARPAMPLSSAVDQARTLVATSGNTREDGDLPPILDLEVTGGLAPGQLAAWTRTWLDTAQQLTGRVPILYTGQYFWRDAVGDASGFTGFPLWLAAYQDSSPPAPYAGGWSHWTLWQYTSSATVPGIGDPADASAFCCGSGALRGLADGRDTLIARKWAALGGAGGVLGAATDAETPFQGGWLQTYEHGVIVTSAQGTFAVVGRTALRYLHVGGPGGSLGPPTADGVRDASGDASVFTGGQVLAAAHHPAYVVTGAILAHWLAVGGRHASGYPVSDAYRVGAAGLGPAGAGLEQDFVAGSWLSGRTTGTHEVSGPILAAYRSVGGADGPLGLPTSDQHPVLVGSEVTFQVGSIVYVRRLNRAIPA